MGKLDGKTIWITGASSGIGEALAYALDKRSCKLILSSRKIVELERVKANCLKPENIKIITLDLANLTDIDAKTKMALAAFGTIDVLINNAGISQRSQIIDTDISVYKKLMDINYLGTVALTKSLLPHFIETKKGHVVTISSLMGKFAGPQRSGYCGSKHALHGFFDALRLEHEKDGLTVTMVCPGYVRTNIDKNALTADGSPQNKQDLENQSGLPPDQLAEKMIKGITHKKFETYIGGKETLGVYLKRFFPRLLHRVVLRTLHK